MKTLFKHTAAVFLTVAMLCCGMPAAALAEDSSSDADASSLSEVISLDELDDEATLTDDADDAGESAEEAEEQCMTYTATVTVDAAGEVVEAEDGAGSDEDDSLSLQETDSTAADEADDSSSTATEDTADEVTVVSTEDDVTTTYKLSITLTTKAVSSSDSTVKTVKVTRPKLTTTTTTTTTTTYSDGTTSTSDPVTTTKTTSYGLTVKLYVRGVGWKKASLNSAGTAYSYTASNSSDGAYISAIKISPSEKLTAALKTAGLTFAYRTTTEYFGTLGWAKAGQKAGTVGNRCPLTGIELEVLTTAKAKKLDTSNRYITTPTVTYKTKYTSASSWNSAKTNGSTSGKSSKTLGAVALKLTSSSSFSGSIKYSVRTKSSDTSANWSAYKKNYATAGSSSSKIRAIKIKLTGDMATYYDVYYRVYVKGIGWLGWASNGQKAGTKNSSSSISAIQVKLVPKGQSAPGSTSYRYVSSTSTKMKMVLRAQSYSSTSKYLILVNRSACKVGIFTGSKGNWTLKYYWSCCVGKASTPTISGTFKTGSKGYSFGESKGYSCYYWTRIYGGYLFHSVLYYPYSSTIKDGTMGKAVSHGCVRLTKTHAKWIYDHIPTGTTVNIY